MNICPQCGFNNEQNVYRCINCNHEFEPTNFSKNNYNGNNNNYDNYDNYNGYNRSYNQGNTNGLSIASLVLGIVSFFCIGFLTGTLAVIFGLVSISQIDRLNGEQKGRGMSIAGIILGIIGAVLSVIFGIFTMGMGCLF